MLVPIDFEYQGKNYSGEFTTSGGMGGLSFDNWHLVINKFYQGQLHYSQSTDRWQFHSNDKKFEELSDYFEAYMIGWFGSKPT